MIARFMSLLKENKGILMVPKLRDESVTEREHQGQQEGLRKEWRLFSSPTAISGGCRECELKTQKDQSNSMLA